MVNSVSFDTQDGPVSLTATGPDTATLVWQGKTYGLIDVAVGGDEKGPWLECNIEGEPFGIKPHLVFELLANDLKVTLTQSWVQDGVSDYTISVDERDQIAAFLPNAGFLKQ